MNDLILHSVRGGVQGCVCVMALSVTGERVLWLNLSSLAAKDKTELMDATLDPRGLFSEAVGQMQKRSEDKKQGGEAFNLCLPRKEVQQPHQAVHFQAAQPVKLNMTMGFRGPKPQPKQENPRPNTGSKLWRKLSFAAVGGGRSLSLPPQEGKRKRPT